jgi:hypothetical protein
MHIRAGKTSNEECAWPHVVNATCCLFEVWVFLDSLTLMSYLGAKIADETVLVQKKSIGERNHLYERRERRTGRCVKKKLWCVCERPFCRQCTSAFE